jgi:hypothetical protein
MESLPFILRQTMANPLQTGKYPYSFKTEQKLQVRTLSSSAHILGIFPFA